MTSQRFDGRASVEASYRRRSTLVRSALVCFTTGGYEGTGVVDIIRHAKATTGTFYHYFPLGKVQIAAAVQVAALADYQAGALKILEAHPEARSGIRAGVRYHLEWVRDHPREALFLFADHPAEVRSATDGELAGMNRRFFAAIDRWLARHVQGGKLRPVPRPIALALWVGPAQELGRQDVRGRSSVSLAQAIELLADGAWESLRASGPSRAGLRKPTRHISPTRARALVADTI